jgi:hypothetical protein
MEELTNQYRVEIALPLLRLEGDFALDREHKLVVLRAAIENLQQIVHRLHNQDEEQALAKSNEWRSLADMSEQLRAALRRATTGTHDRPEWFVV